MAKRFGIRAGERVAIVAAPKDYPGALVDLPDDVTLRESARGHNDVIVFFATRRNELARRIAAFARSLDDDGRLWIAWPRRTSGVIHDLSEREIRAIGIENGLIDTRVCTIDASWSGVRFVHANGHAAPRLGQRSR